MKRTLLYHAALVGLCAAMALVGCDKKDEPAPGGDKAQQGQGMKAAGGPAAAPTLESPADVVIYGGTNGLEDGLTKLHALASKVVPNVPPLGAMAGPMLQGQMRLKDAAAIDTKKPVRFAIVDPKTYKRDPVIVLIGITDQKAFEAALPETGRKQDDEGNAWSFLKYEGATRPIYVNFVGGHAAITRDKAMFAKYKDFLGKLATAPLPELGGVVVEVAHLVTLFGPELDQGIAQAKQMAAMAAQTTPGGASQAQMIGTMFDWMGSAARDLERVRVSLATIDDGALLNIAFDAKAGSDLAKLLGVMKGKGAPALLAKVPADSPAFMTASIDPAATADLVRKLAESMIVGPMFAGDAAKAKVYIDGMTTYAKALDGQMVVAAHNAADGSGLAMTGFFGISDLAAARAGQKTLTGMYTDEAAKAYYTQNGITVNYQPAAYTVGDVSVDIIETQLTNLPPEAAQFAGIMKEFMTSHIALGKEWGVMGYGSAARATVEAALSGKLVGGLDAAPGPQRAIKHAAANAAFMVYVSPIELAKRIKLNGMNPLANMLAGIDNKTGIAISGGASGSTLQVVIDVPLETVQQGMAAFEKSKGAF